MIATCALTFASCNSDDKIAGTYEMTSISGTVTYGGETIELEEDLYDYYRITLKKNGSCMIESKASGSTTKVEEEGTWEYDDGILKIKSNPSGITTVEEMTWEDDVIIYEAEQNASGMKIEMKLRLEKVD